MAESTIPQESFIGYNESVEQNKSIMHRLGALYTDYIILSGEYPEEAMLALHIIRFIRPHSGNLDDMQEFLDGGIAANAAYVDIVQRREV